MVYGDRAGRGRDKAKKRSHQRGFSDRHSLQTH